MTDTKINFSFLKLFNKVKGINSKVKLSEVNENWLENDSPEE
jgi:hypothetical protein